MAAGLQLGCSCECCTNIQLSFLAARANKPKEEQEEEEE